MWIYAFGSIARGELSPTSDVDVLLIREESEVAQAPSWAQCYSESELSDIFRTGDLFAYHLHAESTLIHSTSGTDIIEDLGRPGPYNHWKSDLDKFMTVVRYAVESLADSPRSVFHKGLLYMGCRDIAMIYAHVEMGTDNFSRESPYHLDVSPPAPIEVYREWNCCRLASTRGIWRKGVDAPIDGQCLRSVSDWLSQLSDWGASCD